MANRLTLRGVALALRRAGASADARRRAFAPTSRPATRSTRSNVDKVKDLISPGHGVVHQARLPDHHHRDRSASSGRRRTRRPPRSTRAQVKLSADGLDGAELRRRAAVPEHRPEGSAGRPQDHVELRATTSSRPTTSTCATSTPTPARSPQHGPLTVERHFLLDHFRRLFWTGRLYVDPKPEKPNPNGYRAQQGLYPILEPFDLKGVGALGNRYIDSGEAGRLLALPAVAPPRAPALDRAALRRALRPGHRRRQLLRLRRPHRLDGLEVPRRAGDPRRRPRASTSR